MFGDEDKAGHENIVPISVLILVPVLGSVVERGLS